MDGVRGGEPAPVLRLATVGGEGAATGPVHLGEPLYDQVAGGMVLGVLLKEPAAHDLEALLGGGGSPGGLHATKGVLEDTQGLFAALAADLDLGGR